MTAKVEEGAALLADNRTVIRSVANMRDILSKSFGLGPSDRF
jgi:hypothetical protein